MIIQDEPKETSVKRFNNLSNGNAENDNQVTTNANISTKKKSVAIALCMIVFGAFGLHRFYVGKTKSGGLMLFLSFISCGTIGGIWGMIDLFTLIFTDNFTDANDLPLVGNGLKIVAEYIGVVIACIFLLYRCAH